MTDSTHLVAGREVTLPVRVGDATIAFASYLVPLGAARSIVDDPRVEVVTVLPGRAMLSLASIEYRENDLGAYHELAIAFVAQTDPARGRQGIGSYIHRLPVTTSFSCEAGRTIWGLPKTVDALEIEDHGDRRSTRLAVGGRHALTLTVKMKGRRSFTDAPQAALAKLDGTIRRTPFRASGTGLGVRLGGATIELGEGEVADELRRLGLPKRAVMSGGVRHMQAAYDAAEIVHANQEAA